MTSVGSSTVLLLARAESEIAILDRTRPLGFADEYRRVVAAWRHGQSELPMLRYARGKNLAPLQRALTTIAEHGDAECCDGSWLVGRAIELLLESRIADAVGTSALAALASERYSLPDAAVACELEELARCWILAAAESEGMPSADPRANEQQFCSDDRDAFDSLWSTLSRRLGQLRLPVRIRIDPALVPVAACADDAIIIRGGTWLSANSAVRITEHEVTGHLLPRLAARARVDVLRCGCAGATDDEEGRALLIERRLGLMDRWRRADLGSRHLACSLLRRGASFVDTVRALMALGAPLEMAIRSALRAGRGGGLGREIVYLAAMRRIGEAFAIQPELERSFEEGRASLAYALARSAATRAA